MAKAVKTLPKILKKINFLIIGGGYKFGNVFNHLTQKT